DQVLPLCDVGLGVAQYKRTVDAPKEDVDCVFYLCGIEEDDDVRELRCEHLFHRRCLDRWLAHQRALCPLCRDALVPHGPVATKSGEMDEEELDDTAAVWFACYPWWMW
ncbi:Zinc finger, C3HC4 type (RING finger), partial [Musa troglodytarum]